MTTEKPTILFSHGAFHGPPHFQPLTDALIANGFPVVCRRHPSCTDDADFYDNSLYDDARALRLEAERLVQAGKKVVVVSHSYGGMVMSEAITAELGFDKIKGQTGGVLGLVYVCAVLMRQGMNYNLLVGREDVPAILPFASQNHDSSFQFNGDPEMFYNDLNADEQKHWYSLLRPMAQKPLVRDRQTRAAWNYFPSMYLYCTLDKAISMDLQKSMVQVAKDDGANVKEVTMEVGHSPFLVDPKTMAQHIGEFAQSF